MIILIGGFVIVQASAICIGYVKGKEEGIEQTSKYFREIMLKRQMEYKFSKKALPFANNKPLIREVQKLIAHNIKFIE